MLFHVIWKHINLFFLPSNCHFENNKNQSNERTLINNVGYRETKEISSAIEPKTYIIINNAN